MPEIEPVAVCEATKPNSLHPWRCQLRAGHDPADQHMWPIESEHYNHPLSHFDRDWLEKELRMQLYNLRTAKADHEAETRGMRTRFGDLLRGLIELTPANTKRKNVPAEAVRDLWQAAIHGR